jgi:Electron transfer flavoprotein domain
VTPSPFPCLGTADSRTEDKLIEFWQLACATLPIIIHPHQSSHHFSKRTTPDVSYNPVSRQIDVDRQFAPTPLTMLPIARVSALRAIRRTPTTLSTPSHSPTSSLIRLLSTLAVLEQKDGKLIGGSLCAVTAGKKLGGPVTGFLAGSNIKNVAEQAAKGYGMEKVVMVDNEAYDKVRASPHTSWYHSHPYNSQGLPENFAPLLVENINKGGYTHIVASHSAFGKSLLPRVAALLDVQQMSDVMSIQSEDSKPAKPPTPTLP